MAKSFFEELTGYRVKVERDGREIVNIPGILALPIALAAPKASIIGTIAAPLLGCNIHLENGNGRKVDVGKAVKDAADTVAEKAATAAKTVREEIEEAWNSIPADDPEEKPAEDGEKEAPAGGEKDEDGIPTIHVKPDDSEKE